MEAGSEKYHWNDQAWWIYPRNYKSSQFHLQGLFTATSQIKWGFSNKLKVSTDCYWQHWRLSLWLHETINYNKIVK